MMYCGPPGGSGASAWQSVSPKRSHSSGSPQVVWTTRPALKESESHCHWVSRQIKAVTQKKSSFVAKRAIRQHAGSISLDELPYSAVSRSSNSSMDWATNPEPWFSLTVFQLRSCAWRVATPTFSHSSGDKPSQVHSWYKATDTHSRTKECKVWQPATVLTCRPWKHASRKSFKTTSTSRMDCAWLLLVALLRKSSSPHPKTWPTVSSEVSPSQVDLAATHTAQAEKREIAKPPWQGNMRLHSCRHKPACKLSLVWRRICNLTLRISSPGILKRFNM